MTKYQKWQVFFGILFLICTISVTTRIIKSRNVATPVIEEVVEAEQSEQSTETEQGNTVGNNNSNDVTSSPTGNSQNAKENSSPFKEFLSPDGLVSIITLFSFFLARRKDKREEERHQREMKKTHK